METSSDAFPSLSFFRSFHFLSSFYVFRNWKPIYVLH
jgi:hypothetical protein